MEKNRNIYGKYLVACHDILFKEKKLFKEKSSVFTLLTFNAIHRIVNSGFLGVGFQFFYLPSDSKKKKKKSNLYTMSSNYFCD